MTDTKLSPCPFCGGEITQYDTNKFSCLTAACGLFIFAHCSTAGHAQRLWNKRAALTAGKCDE